MFGDFLPAVLLPVAFRSRHDSGNRIMFCQLRAAYANWGSVELNNLGLLFSANNVHIGDSFIRLPGPLLFAISFPVPDRPQTMRNARGHGYTRILQAAFFHSDGIIHPNNTPRVLRFHCGFLSIWLKSKNEWTNRSGGASRGWNLRSSSCIHVRRPLKRLRACRTNPVKYPKFGPPIRATPRGRVGWLYSNVWCFQAAELLPGTREPPLLLLLKKMGVGSACSARTQWPRCPWAPRAK